MGQDVKKTNKYVKKIRPEPSSIIAISDFSREEFSKNHLIMPGHVIPLGVTAISYSGLERNIDLLAVGSLVPLKQFDVFIELVNRIKKYYPRLNAFICGKGPEEEKLIKLVDHYKLNENITFTGELPHSKILEMMSRTKVFVHPSSFEGFSGVCLEALHSGAYVVSFIQPMKHDIANWFVVDSLQKMEERVIAILENKPENYPVNAYPVDISVTTIANLYKI